MIYDDDDESEYNLIDMAELRNKKYRESTPLNVTSLPDPKGLEESVFDHLLNL